MKLRQKLPIVALCMAVMMLFPSCGTTPEDQQQAFDAFIQEDFVSTMESDYLTNHIYLENPQDFGVDESQITVSLGTRFDPDSFQQTRDDLDALEKEFSKFDREKLTAEQQVTYDIYKALLDLAKTSSSESFDYYASYFDSMTGIHTSLPTLFSDLTLRDEQDVKDVIVLMQDVRPYVQSLLEYVKAQEEHGTLMVDTESVISQCEQYTQSGEDSPILTSMYEHIDQLNLDPTAAQGYKDQLKEAFTTSFLPAYQDIIDTMKGLDPQKNNTMGLAHLEHGKEYYEYLFQEATGTSHSIEEVETMLRNAMDDALGTMIGVYMVDPDSYNAFYNGDYQTSFTSYQEMMDFLTEAIQGDYPAIGDVEYTLQSLDAELANSGIAAYFNIPAIDGTTPMSIFVNDTSGREGLQALDTFSTVAHEGIPGHLYMTVYQNQHLPNAWRKAIPNFSGYTEGYATYVEVESLG